MADGDEDLWVTLSLEAHVIFVASLHFFRDQISYASGGVVGFYCVISLYSSEGETSSRPVEMLTDLKPWICSDALRNAACSRCKT